MDGWLLLLLLVFAGPETKLAYPAAISAKDSPVTIAEATARDGCQPGRRLTPQVFASVPDVAATSDGFPVFAAPLIFFFFGVFVSALTGFPLACASASAAAAAAAFTARSFRFRIAERESFVGGQTSSAIS